MHAAAKSTGTKEHKIKWWCDQDDKKHLHSTRPAVSDMADMHIYRVDNNWTVRILFFFPFSCVCLFTKNQI